MFEFLWPHPQNVLDDMLSIFHVHISAFIPFFILLAAPRGTWDLSSVARDQTCTSCIGSTVLTTGPPGKSPAFISLKCQLFGIISSYEVQVFLSFKSSLHPLSLPTKYFFFHPCDKMIKFTIITTKIPQLIQRRGMFFNNIFKTYHIICIKTVMQIQYSIQNDFTSIRKVSVYFYLTFHFCFDKWKWHVLKITKESELTYSLFLNYCLKRVKL